MVWKGKNPLSRTFTFHQKLPVPAICVNWDTKPKYHDSALCLSRRKYWHSRKILSALYAIANYLNFVFFRILWKFRSAQQPRGSTGELCYWLIRLPFMASSCMFPFRWEKRKSETFKGAWTDHIGNRNKSFTWRLSFLLIMRWRFRINKYTCTVLFKIKLCIACLNNMSVSIFGDRHMSKWINVPTVSSCINRHWAQFYVYQVFTGSHFVHTEKWLDSRLKSKQMQLLSVFFWSGY